MNAENFVVGRYDFRFEHHAAVKLIFSGFEIGEHVKLGRLKTGHECDSSCIYAERWFAEFSGVNNCSVAADRYHNVAGSDHLVNRDELGFSAFEFINIITLNAIAHVVLFELLTDVKRNL